MSRPPLPPFTAETAAQKARMAEDAWNTRDPAGVALAYTVDSVWRNRAEFLRGREAIEAFLTRKWARELDYRLIKEVWTWRDNRIAVRFAYEWHDDSGNWFRSYGNENWEFDEHGLMRRRRQHQRPADQGERAQIPLAPWPPSRWPPGFERPRALGVRKSPSLLKCTDIYASITRAFSACRKPNRSKRRSLSFSGPRPVPQWSVRPHAREVRPDCQETLCGHCEQA